MVVPPERLIVGGVLVVLWLGSAAELSAQCDTLDGEVTAGESYERAFAEGLLFRLRPWIDAPLNPQGWTIEVRAGPDGKHDFVYLATPPYRFSNPRDSGTSYGQDSREAVARDVRRFGFVTSEEAFEPLSEAVGILIFSRRAEVTEAQYEAAYDSVYARWQAMLDRAGKGELRITDAEVSDPRPDRPGGRIERLAFTVTLCPGGDEPPQAR